MTAGILFLEGEREREMKEARRPLKGWLNKKDLMEDIVTGFVIYKEKKKDNESRAKVRLRKGFRRTSRMLVMCRAFKSLIMRMIGTRSFMSKNDNARKKKANFVLGHISTDSGKVEQISSSKVFKRVRTI